MTDTSRTAKPKSGTLEWYAYHGTSLLGCPQCGSFDLFGSDSDDAGHIITCRSCKLEHCGVFGESTAKSWNEGKIKPWIGPVQIFERNRSAHWASSNC
jgi:hypothetical protein